MRIEASSTEHAEQTRKIRDGEQQRVLGPTQEQRLDPGWSSPSSTVRKNPYQKHGQKAGGTSSRWPLRCSARRASRNPGGSPERSGPALPAGSSARMGAQVTLDSPLWRSEGRKR